MGSNSIKVSTSKGKHLNNVKTNETLDRHKPALDPDTVVHQDSEIDEKQHLSI